MKRLLKTSLLTVLCWVFIYGAANAAVTRTTVTKDSNGIMSGVTAWQNAYSGQSIIVVDPTAGISGFFNRLDVISLHGPAGSGISQLASGTSGYIVVYNSSIGAGPQKYISGATVDPNSDIFSGVSTTREITGKTFFCDLQASATLSGNSIYGGTIGNWGASYNSEVTATVPNAVRGMTILFHNNQGTTTGGTMFVKLNSADSFVGLSSAFSAGASVVMLSGTTLGSYLNLEARQTGRWYATGVSGISYRNGQ